MKVCRETPNLVEIRQKYGAIQMNTCVCFFFVVAILNRHTSAVFDCIRLLGQPRTYRDPANASLCSVVRMLPVFFFCQEIICISWNPKAHYNVQESTTVPCPIPLYQYHPVHSPTLILIQAPPPHQRLGFPSDIFFQVFPTKHGVLFFPMCVRHGIGHYSKTYNADMGGRLLRRSWNTWREGWTIWGSNTDRGKRSFLRNFQTGTGATSLVFNVSRGIFPLV